MNPATRQRLLREIARATEAAYRRGFQHGHDTAKRGEPLAVDLEAWRFKVPLHRAPSPHGLPATTAEDRLRIEYPQLGRVLARTIGEEGGR